MHLKLCYCKVVVQFGIFAKEAGGSVVEDDIVILLSGNYKHKAGSFTLFRLVDTLIRLYMWCIPYNPVSTPKA